MTPPDTIAVVQVAGYAVAVIGFAAASFSLAWFIQQRKIDAAQRTGRLVADWWTAAVDKQLAAEAKLDLIHHQHVEAGKAAHAADKAKRLAVAEHLKMLPVQKLPPRDQIAAEVRAAREAGRAA